MKISKSLLLMLSLACVLVGPMAQGQSDQKKTPTKPAGSNAQLSDASARETSSPQTKDTGAQTPSATKSRNTNLTDMYAMKKKSSPDATQSRAINANPGPHHRPGSQASNARETPAPQPTPPPSKPVTIAPESVK